MADLTHEEMFEHITSIYTQTTLKQIPPDFSCLDLKHYGTSNKDRIRPLMESLYHADKQKTIDFINGLTYKIVMYLSRWMYSSSETKPCPTIETFKPCELCGELLVPFTRGVHNKIHHSEIVKSVIKNPNKMTYARVCELLIKHFGQNLPTPQVNIYISNITNSRIITSSTGFIEVKGILRVQIEKYIPCIKIESKSRYNQMTMFCIGYSKEMELLVRILSEPDVWKSIKDFVAKGEYDSALAMGALKLNI